MLPVVSNLDLIIVPYRLEVAGFATHKATELFGYLTGMSVPLINLATILTAAMAMSLVPAVSHSFTLGDKSGIYEQTAGAARITLLVTIPFSVMLYVLAGPVVSFIYNAPAATEATAAIAPAICFLGMHQITTAILQGLKKPKIPVINMFIACIVKVICNWFLVAVPSFGITGAAYATVADIGVAAGLNLIFIYKYTGYILDLRVVVRNTIIAAVMGVSMYFIHASLAAVPTSLFIGLLVTTAAGSAVYLVLMSLSGGLTRRDAQKLPFFGKYFY